MYQIPIQDAPNVHPAEGLVVLGDIRDRFLVFKLNTPSSRSISKPHIHLTHCSLVVEVSFCHIGFNETFKANKTFKVYIAKQVSL